MTSTFSETELLGHLDACLGQTVILEGRRLRIIERLPGALVFEDLDALELERDFHGRTEGFAPRLYTVPLHSSLGGLHPTIHAAIQATIHASPPQSGA